MCTQILKLNEVVQRTTLSSSTVYRLIKAGHFPKPIKLATHASGWLESEINEWIIDRREASGTLK